MRRGRTPKHPAASRRCTQPCCHVGAPVLWLENLILTPILTQVHPVLRQLEVVLSTTSFFLSFFVLFWVRESMHAGHASMLRMPPGWCHRTLPRPPGAQGLGVWAALRTS
jgi:hypothetical protein